VIGAIALAALLSLAFAPRAEALIYWSNFGDTTIGRANLDGTGVDKTFIDPNGSPTGLAVDEAHVYWASPFGGADLIDSIGRANLDGTGVDHNFIAGANLPTAVAVDDAHVYWANWGTDSIGRANLDGTGVDQGLIPAGGPFGVAVDATHVYFDSGRDSIGRANLDGTGVDPSFIAAASFPQGVAVDDAHVYWTTGRDSIGRANLDGTGVDPSFIAGVSAGNVAVDAAHVYWSSRFTDSIGRANLDGTGVDPSFIAGAGDPWGVAVDPLAFVSLGKVNKNTKRGTAKVTVKVPVPGELELAKTRLVKGQDERAEAAGKEKLSIKPRRKASQKLVAKGKTRVKAKVTYTPDGGEPDTRSKRINLVKR
jgi:virginiamycin B lyase